MNKAELEKISKSELINLILQQNQKTTKRKPIPTPRRSVKEMIQDYEENIIKPPLEFRKVFQKRICGVTSSTNFKLLLVYRFVVLVLFPSSFVSVLRS